MKIKGILLASAAGAAAFTPSAQAADLPMKAYPAAAPAAAASWAGFYMGLHAGGASVKNWMEGEDYNNSASFIGGGQIGYNWQSGSFVFGLEADGSWLSKQKYQTGDNGINYGTQMPWLATARGRFGAALGNWHLYATAGAAFTSVKFKDCCFGPTGQISMSKSRVGWAVGGGVEHMLSRNWVVGAEVLYVDFGRTEFRPLNGDRKNTMNSAVIGRAKLNYKF
jgi:outer membrane immunogenic protein